MRHLPLGRLDDDFRIDQPRRTDHLLDDFAAGLFQFDLARRGRDEDHLVPHLLEFFVFQRAVVQRLGSRKPCSTSTSLRWRSPLYIALICGSVTCDSSMMSR